MTGIWSDLVWDRSVTMKYGLILSGDRSVTMEDGLILSGDRSVTMEDGLILSGDRSEIIMMSIEDMCTTCNT